MAEGVLAATGRRKEAVARVWMEPGSGKIIVNRRDVAEYFGRESSVMIIQQPLVLTETIGKYDIKANVKGGGLSGQAGAMRLAIARALATVDESVRKALRSNGLLTRDPRMTERKKYGLVGARKRYQFSKR